MSMVFSLSAAVPHTAVALFITIATVLVFNFFYRKKVPYPPGPKPKFLIGNALDFPVNGATRKYIEWSTKYRSNILYASAFGMHVIIINSRKIADDLLEGRSQIYDDRPYIPIAELVGWHRVVGLLRYGDEWKQHRKLCHQNFHAGAHKQYFPIQTDRVHNFLRCLLREPEKYFQHISLLSISSTMLMTYGYAPASVDDPVVKAAGEGAKIFGSLFQFNGTLINVFPILRHIPAWVPGATSQKQIKRLKWLTDEAKRIPLEYVKAAMKKGTASSSLVTDFLEQKATVGAKPEEEALINDLAWTIYGAASDTMISSTHSFLYLIVKHPEVQRRAQSEIDLLTGNARLPNFSDRPFLPYIEAIYLEVLRHTPPFPLGVAHSTTEENIYEGYVIPKGAIILTNIWAMTHDEDEYPDPFAFKPERFLDSDGKIKSDARVLAYGFGRRICVGKFVASSSLWFNIVSFLATFDINKAKDEFGNEIEIDDKYNDIGSVTHKTPFKCSITPRSQQTRKLIESTLDV